MSICFECTQHEANALEHRIRKLNVDNEGVGADLTKLKDELADCLLFPIVRLWDDLKVLYACHRDSPLEIVDVSIRLYKVNSR